VLDGVLEIWHDVKDESMSLQTLSKPQIEIVFQHLLEHLLADITLTDEERVVLPALETMFQQCVSYRDDSSYWQILREPWAEALVNLEPEQGVAVLRVLVRLPGRRTLRNRQIAAWADPSQRTTGEFPGSTFNQAYEHLERVTEGVIQTLIGSKLPFSNEVAFEVFRAYWTTNPPGFRVRHILNWLKIFGRFIRADWDAYSPLVEPEVEQLVHSPFWSNKSRFELAQYVHELRSASNAQSKVLNFDGWGEAMLERLSELPKTERAALEKLLGKLAKTAGKSPSETWTRDTRALAEQYGLERYRALCFDGLERFLRGSSDAVKFKIGDKNKGVLTAFAWSLLWFQDDPRTPGLLGDAAVAGLRKMSGVGIRAEKVGMAAVYALTQLEGAAGVTHLLRVRDKAPQQRQRTMLSGVVDEVAGRLGLSEADLLEVSTPDYGLQDGVVRLEISGFRAEVRVHGREARTAWFARDGKAVKTVPTQVKRDQAQAVKELKRLERDVENQLKFHADRLDVTLMQSPDATDWTYPVWLKRYAHHPLLGLLAGRLIWRFTTGNTVQDGVFLNGRVVDVHGEPIQGLSDVAGVRLWHPLFSSPTEVRAWREFLNAHEIMQPFWQAHRTVYILTDAERATRTYSNRFAGHILRNFQLARLCDARGWAYNAFHNDDNGPSVYLGDWDITAEFWVGYADSADHISTDQVRFYRGQTHEPLALEDVPALAFTETMRDVDFFVGVGSVGNDPTWQDGGPGWQAYSFGDLTQTAQTRKEVLETILPRLKIKDRVNLEGKFLLVRGDIRTYKIHLGSGNILMLPNDEYLCIVQDRSSNATSTFLPFEGDGTLAVILSKAFMLAEDLKIKDETITRQIKP
jgi:Domain of unknown function (DUF4132)